MTLSIIRYQSYATQSWHNVYMHDEMIHMCCIESPHNELPDEGMDMLALPRVEIIRGDLLIGSYYVLYDDII